MIYAKQSNNRTRRNHETISYNLLYDKLQTQQGLIDLENNIQSFEDYILNDPNKHLNNDYICASIDTNKSIYLIDINNIVWEVFHNMNTLIDLKYIPISTYNSETKQVVVQHKGVGTLANIEILDGSDTIKDDTNIQINRTGTGCSGFIDNKFRVYSTQLYKISTGDTIDSNNRLYNYYEYIGNDNEDIVYITSSDNRIDVCYTDSTNVVSFSFDHECDTSIASIIDDTNKIFKLITVQKPTDDENTKFIMYTVTDYNDESNVAISSSDINFDNDQIKQEHDFIYCALYIHDFNGEKYITCMYHDTFYTFFYDEENNQMLFKDKIVFNFPKSFYDYTPIPPNYTEGFLIHDFDFYLVRFTPNGWKYYGEKFLNNNRILLINDDIYHVHLTNSNGVWNIYKDKLTQIESFDIVFEKQNYYYELDHDINTYIKLIKSNFTNMFFRLQLKIISDNAKFTDQNARSIYHEVLPTDVETKIPLTITGPGNVNIQTIVIDKFSSTADRNVEFNSNITFDHSLVINDS